jgi:60 kDa SS-A/Ro ribonucleoprotein
MASLNKKIQRTPVFTQEGAPAKNVPALLELRRSVLATMLWEDSFYEDGVEIADRIASLVPKVSGKQAAALAVELRSKGKLRHVPLKVVREMARTDSHKPFVADTLFEIIQRPDELTEFVAIYWGNKKQPLSAQVKKGLAKAFTKFDAYQLSKYNRDNAIKLRDVLFLCHAKPKDKEQEVLWKQLVNDKLETADTWEARLSATKGEKKEDAWESLLKENKLGALALLRNLRNMKESGVSETLIRKALKEINVERVLPFRFITAARYAPNLEPELEEAMLKCLNFKGKIKGKTRLVVDVSGSMAAKISAKSELTRMDAAAALAILAREMFEDVEIYTVSNRTVQVPTRRGFALRDAVVNSQEHSGTELGAAVDKMNNLGYDRLIVFTDEQSRSPVAQPVGKYAYMINVANEKYGVGYGKWGHIDGFSEATLDYIVELEKIND